MHYKSLLNFGLKFILYRLAKFGLMKYPNPITLTYSITNLCNSKCKTCYLWEHYKKEPELLKKELKTEEIEKIFKNIGEIFFFNVSGGEPFLRKDFAQIIEMACKYLKPRVIHTPTNGLMPEKIEKTTKEIMDIICKYDSSIKFTIKPSFDGIGEKHDKIRGVKGNFENAIDTFKRLKNLQNQYANMDVGLGTVISRFNVNDIEEIANYAEKLNADSHISEIAEQRAELFTLNKEIEPKYKDYEKAITYFSNKIRANLKKRKNLAKKTEAFRLVYYNLVLDILKKKKQAIPCFAGITNAHITPWGDVWPCCVLGYNKSMGNLRDYDYDFKKLWNSKDANQIRKYIINKNCYCPLANQAYSNMLMDIKSLISVFKNTLIK